jgi:hypothetical protein
VKFFFLLLSYFSLYAAAPIKTDYVAEPIPKASGCSFLVRIRDACGESPLEWSSTDFYKEHQREWVNYGQWEQVDDGDHINIRYSCALCWQETSYACMDCQVIFRDGISYYWNEYIPAGCDQVEFRAIYDCPNHVARFTPTWWHCDCAEIGVPLPEPE